MKKWLAHNLKSFIPTTNIDLENRWPAWTWKGDQNLWHGILHCSCELGICKVFWAWACTSTFGRGLLIYGSEIGDCKGRQLLCSTHRWALWCFAGSIWRDPEAALADRVDDLVGQLTVEEMIASLDAVTHPTGALPRLGIPGFTGWNGTHLTCHQPMSYRTTPQPYAGRWNSAVAYHFDFFFW